MGENQLPRIIVPKLLERCTTNREGVINYLKRLKTAETNLIRVNIVYEDMKKHNLLPKLIRDKKSDSLAITHKERGNKHFGTGNYEKALEEYTRCIATAETPAVRAVAYANRSACLLRLDRHEDCIVDIERALANNYPDELKEKIIKRREQAEKLQKHQEKYHEEVPEILESQKNPLIQCASDCVKIECNEEYGRHIVATRDIEIGELIVVEKPFVSAVLSELLVHCHNCLELCYNPIPCSSCTQILFCGEACKDQAQIYHKYECSILLSMAKGEIDFMKKILRSAVLAKQEYEQLDTYRFDLNEYYRSDRFKEIYCLKSKPLPTNDTDPILLSKSIVTASVFHWLESTDFFENDNIKNHCKEILLSQLLKFERNATGVLESVYKNNCGLDDKRENNFGAAVYSFGSLFNHSCCPNINYYFYGSTLTLWSANTIKKGEQCFFSYGSDYFYMSKSKRQSELNRKYSFICKCKACEEDWEGHVVQYSQLMKFPTDICDMHTDKIAKSDLVFAKEMLPVYVRMLKKCEDTEPWGNAYTLKTLITHCHNVMANNRMRVH